MFLAHSFRLRDPWQCECGENGAMRWSRVFHKPTGLEADDALWLVCSGLSAEAAVTLNGAALSPANPTGVPPVLPGHQYDVTALIKDSNRIELQVPASLQPPASGLQPDAFPYDVRLGVVGHS